MADAISAIFAAAHVWLQPLATVIAGTLAVLAAAIAYRAVTRQIKANAENVQKQIDAAAAEERKNRDADWARMRRQEVLDLLLDTGQKATKLAQIARSYSMATDPELSDDPPDENVTAPLVEEFAEIVAPDRWQIMLGKLEMHGLTAVSATLSTRRNR
jgi:hypothetical protein